MPREFFYAYPNDDYNGGIVLEEYNGVLSLVAGGKGQGNGTVYKKWGFPQKKDKQPTERAIPWKIQLGNDREAVAALKYFLAQLTNEQPQQPAQGEDIPF